MATCPQARETFGIRANDVGSLCWATHIDICLVLLYYLCSLSGHHRSHQKLIYQFFGMVPLMVQKSHSQPPFGCINPCKMIGYLPYQLVNAGFPNHQYHGYGQALFSRVYVAHVGLFSSMSWLSDIPWDHKAGNVSLGLAKLPIEK